MWRDLGTALASPLALARLPRRAWRWLAIYLGAAALVLGGVGWFVASHWLPAKDWLIEALVPTGWQTAVRWLLDQFFRQAERGLVANAIASGSLMLVTLSLFLVKEQLSKAFEEDAALLPGEPIDELPILVEGWQELKLFGAYLAVQGSLFWLGLRPGARGVAVALSYGFTVLTYTIDFVSPIWQRHQGRYSQILKGLGRAPLASLAFGAIFAAPALLAAQAWQRHPEWSVGRAVFVIFGANLIAIAWAAVAGTYLGARLFGRFRASARSRGAARWLAWLMVLVGLGGNLYGFAALGRSIQHKSHLLRCHYAVDLASIGLDTSSLPDLLDDRAHAAVHADLTIENPTGSDVAIEDNRLEVSHHGRVIARSRLSPIAIPAGQRVTRTMTFDLEVSPSVLLEGRGLLDRAYAITLYLRVSPYFELPIDLLGER